MVWGVGPVKEIQLHVVYAALGELLGVVILLVQPHHQLHVLALEVGGVVFWAQTGVSAGVWVYYRD